jgi:putative tricarboxylic transport membrane protein
VRLLALPYRWLYLAILLFSCIGVYSLSNSTLDVLLAAAFGVLGWVFIKLHCPTVPLLLGFILGPMLEENLRRTMLVAGGDPSVFLTRPISLTILCVALVLLALSFAPAIASRRTADERP